MATLSLRINDEENTLFKSYADMHGMTVSELVRTSVLEKIEEEYDLKAYHEAIEEHRKNPITYTHEEVLKMLEEE